MSVAQQALPGQLELLIWGQFGHFSEEAVAKTAEGFLYSILLSQTI